MEKCSLSMATGTAGLFVQKHATPGTFGSSWMDCMCLGGHLRVQWPACRGHSPSPLESYTKTSPFQYFHQHSRLNSTWEEVQLRSCLRGLFSGGKKKPVSNFFAYRNRSTQSFSFSFVMPVTSTDLHLAIQCGRECAEENSSTWQRRGRRPRK